MSASLKRFLPQILVLLVLGLAVGVAIWLKNTFHQEDVQQKKRVQQITMITPLPPPPPPPPPPEIEEPEIQDEPLEEDIPEEAAPDDGPDEAPGEDLGVDAEGEAGSDGFGLKAKKGGRGLLGGGGYGASVRSEINQKIMQDQTLSSLDYQALITLWIDADGSFLRFQVQMLSDNPDAKDELERFLADLGSISKAKPLAEKSDRFKFKISSVI